MKRKWILPALFFLVLFQWACTTDFSKDNPTLTKNALGMNTLIQISIYDEEIDEQILDEAFDYALELENRLSRYVPDSDIAKINGSAGVGYVQVQAETVDLIEKCMDYSEQTEGAFDITLGALTDLWGIAVGKNHIATQEEIDEALRHVGYENILINRDDNAIMLAKQGVILDLGAVGKGYISEKVREFLLEKGVERAIINFGGNIVLIGKNKNDKPFRVGIQEPFNDRGEYLAVVSSEKTALVSSGSYERNFRGDDGTLYHHIMNPFDGRPVQNGLSQVTIVCDDATRADILSTAVFVMGVERGLAYIEQLDDVQAVLVTDEKKVIVTDGLKDNLELLKK